MSVVTIYEAFYGRRPDRTFVLRVPRGAELPGAMAQLGKLRKISGKLGAFAYQNAWGAAEGALLLCTARKILYLYCPGGSFMSLPAVSHVVYQARKRDLQEVVYSHEFKPPAKLIVAPRTDGKFARLQGAYRIEAEGITG